MNLAADVTQVAALAAAISGLIAAVVGGANLAVALTRERPSIAVFIRWWAADRGGFERYVSVVATNVGRRPTTIVAMGLQLESDGRRWAIEDGHTEPALPARVDEGATVTMSWLREELGQEFFEDRASITAGFAVDGLGHKIHAELPDRSRT